MRLEASHEHFYVRNPATDGRTIVYHAGGDLHAFDVASRTSAKIAVDYHSQRTQRQRRYVQAARYVEAADLDPKGERGVYSVRGQIHHMRHWDGPVSVQSVLGSRYRLARFLADGRRVIAVVDRDNGDECLEIWDSADYTVKPVPEPAENGTGVWGRFTLLEASPKGERVAFANHRNELWLLDLGAGTSRKLAANAHGPMGAFAWSPDGRWLAFQQSISRDRSYIAVASVETGEIRAVTEPLFGDFAPSFDPEGRYLYFLSDRVLNPVYDAVQFELSFPKAVLPCLVTLRKDTPSPFLEAATDEPEAGPKDKDKAKENGKELQVEIDFDGIAGRILAFPVPEGRYWAIAGLKKKAMWLSYPVKGALMEEWTPEPPAPEGTLEAFDFKKLKVETLGGGFSWYRLSADRKHMLLFANRRPRVVKAGEKVEDDAAKKLSAREAGWVDLGRLKVLIEPEAEWKQMLHEAWRLQRDHFWRADMSRVDWKGVLLRYAPLVERVNCRSEFGDLVWEMQGELGTSHAYDFGGDYRQEPIYPIGFLGADFVWDGAAGGYRIGRFLRGDPWTANEACPLKAPGIQLEAGDVITAVNGQPLSAAVTPHQALMHQAGAEVYLSVKSADGSPAGPRAHASRREAGPLPRLGRTQPRSRPRGQRRARGLHPHPRHGSARLRGVSPPFSAGLRLRRADRGCALQWRRTRLATAPGKTLPAAAGRGFLALVRRLSVSRRLPGRPARGLDQRIRRLGRRYLLPYVQDEEGGAADRPQNLGRGHRHLAQAPSRRWRRHHAARVLALVRGRGLGRRELRNRPRYRCGHRPA